MDKSKTLRLKLHEDTSELLTEATRITGMSATNLFHHLLKKVVEEEKEKRNGI